MSATNATGARTTGDRPELRLSESQSVLFDFLRLLAAQTVLLGHSFDFFDWNSSLHDPTSPQIQRLAVSVFFLLSGFLIPWSVARRSGARVLERADATPNAPFVDYLIARSTRIYAGLLPALVIIAIADALPAHRFEQDYPPVAGSGSVTTWIANLLHLQEFPLSGISIFGSGDPLWSLAVEWWIYVLFGLAVLRPRGVWLVLWPPAVASVAWNSVGGTGDGIALVWFLGWGTYLVWRRARRFDLTTTSRGWLAAVGIGATLVGVWSAFRWGERSHFGLDLAFALASAVALLAWTLAFQAANLADEKRSSDRDARSFGAPPPGSRRSSARTKIVAWIRGGADTSFTLYLTHFSVLTLLYELRGRLDPVGLVVLALALCNLTAWAASWCGERHTGRLRSWARRIRSRRGPPPGRAAQHHPRRES